MSTNRRILIDNATLSGVERLIGVSQTMNLNNIDNDILCLEKLVTAILFSDKLIGVDDYKDEYRSKRLKNFDFVDFSIVDQSSYDTLSSEAAEFARSMTFSFEGTKPVGDVVSFFEALQVDPQLRWDIFASSEYLTLSFLVADASYTPYEDLIDTIFRNESTDSDLVDSGTDHQPAFSVAERSDITDIKDLLNVFSSQNPQFKGTGHKCALSRVLFGYGWVAERSHFYNSVAKREDSDVFLAPLRDAFCESCYRIDYPSTTNGLLETLKSKSQKTLESILEPSGLGSFAMRLPFFTAFLISKTNNAKECIDLALSMRNTRDFQECRAIFHNLNHLSAADKIQEMNRILRYLDQSCTNLMKKYAVSTESGLQFSLSLGMTGINLGVGTKLNQLLRHHKNRPFTRVFRNIAQDMLNVERLGGLHDKLCSSIRKHRHATYTSVSTTPKFMEHRENPHSRPANL